jgi:hypothetical protein
MSGAIFFCKTNVPWHLVFPSVTNPIFGKTIFEAKDSLSLGGRCGALALLISKSKIILNFS